jgi:hypothetical protein
MRPRRCGRATGYRKWHRHCEPSVYFPLKGRPIQRLWSGQLEHYPGESAPAGELRMGRSAKQVFADHLRRRRQGKLEEDIARNYADDVVLLTGRGMFRGKKGLRRRARLIQKELPCARYEYRTKLVDGDLAFLEWAPCCDGPCVDDGADSFLRLLPSRSASPARQEPRPPEPLPPGARRFNLEPNPSWGVELFSGNGGWSLEHRPGHAGRSPGSVATA